MRMFPAGDCTGVVCALLQTRLLLGQGRGLSPCRLDDVCIHSKPDFRRVRALIYSGQLVIAAVTSTT